MCGQTPPELEGTGFRAVLPSPPDPGSCSLLGFAALQGREGWPWARPAREPQAPTREGTCYNFLFGVFQVSLIRTQERPGASTRMAAVPLS